ncbi:helix-turn-helix domain-containing protein [Clostridium sp. LY3-2]|uniref:helix-turn-helix domain-containing protein n=1 Tax=Clostridium sp. LY3-2 TaxID=2942482 RepID=UPI0021538527|nr:helix-turn-helix transcriptional regulator [Clostridium sp. LY3-2]MCR6516174.1 helix-turn-helix domain-containing protein [Clostridium sp. LY3-2]
MEIGKQIKKHRTEIKLSQDGLAEKIFVSRQTISNWENNKNYPDIKSLLLLSSLFNVSLDVLVKGDLEKMKEKINSEDISKFKREGNIFSILLILTIILPIPLIKFMGNTGIVIWVIIAVLGIYYSIRVEKYKKNFNIQTYKEVIAFIEGKSLDGSEKNQEYGKRLYQKFLLAIGAGLASITIGFIMIYVLF